MCPLAVGAGPNSGFPIVQGLEKQKSLPKKLVLKPAPFPMNKIDDSDLQDSHITPLEAVLEGLNGIGSDARREFEAQQEAKKISLDKYRLNSPGKKNTEATNDEELTNHDDPPTMTSISRATIEVTDAPFTSSSGLPYSSPLGSKLHNPRPLKAREQVSDAAKLEHQLDQSSTLGNCDGLI